MTNDEIKAELRRSACEDCQPFFYVHVDAFRQAGNHKGDESDSLRDMSDDSLRLFFLLVAEAL